MTDVKEAVRKLVDVAYDSGYYSGGGDDGLPHHTKAVEARNALSGLVIAYLDDQDAKIALLKSEVALLTPEPQAPEVKALVDAARAVVQGASADIYQPGCTCGACARRTQLAKALAPFKVPE